LYLNVHPFGLIIERQKIATYHIEERIWSQKVVDTTLDKNPDDGLYLVYCSFGLMIEKTELGNVMDFSIEGGRCGLDKEISPDG
jgi:hypothetical protein